MKIVQICDYQFPAKGNAGAERIVERLCRGLQKLGHEVVLVCKEGSSIPDIRTSQSIPKDFDIIHHHGWCHDKEDEYNSWGLPWVSTIHGGGMETDINWLNMAKNNRHIICVSKFVADRIGCSAFVHSCSDPDEFIYNDKKENYFVYLASLDWGTQKGLDVFVRISRIMRTHNFKLAGGTKNPAIIDYVKVLCKDSSNLKFVGEVNGQEKAKLLSGAKALILPTKLPDACPTTVSEALMSGTPVIGSNCGSMPEIVPPSVGFICEKEIQYVKAVMNIDKINPLDCRNYALENYSDVVAAKKHLTYYEKMLKLGTVQ